MAVSVSRHMFGILGELRIHPVSKWVRAISGGAVVADTRAARLVWEPRRVVPSYAVPVADLDAELVTFDGMAAAESPVRLGRTVPPVLDPSTPFTAHSCPGRLVTLRTRAGDLAGAGFLPEDPDLEGYVVLDWAAFSSWSEEDQEVFGHPHDPFDRIDCLPSSRRVVLSLAGEVLADSSRTTFLYETPLPTRYYFPREDVRMDLLEPSDHTSVCAYKGHATYWSAQVGDHATPAVAWTYEEPLHDAQPVRGMVSFFTERLDLALDGVAVERPVTPWS